jgi:methionyl-tRNA synthetase
MKKFYITTAIPYVNAPPHIGHALEFIQADTIARYQRLLLGDNHVTLLSGGDENALKNVQAAQKAGVGIQEFIDKNAHLFEELAIKLNVRFDIFQKGSNKNHYQSSQKLWELCKKNNPDDIYEHQYEGLYCVGCETFYASDELNENGECYEHPGKKLETVKEKNYFFRLSKYQGQLIDLIKTDVLKIIPHFRKNEVLSFLEGNTLQDISISRSNERAKNWGVPVPGDNKQRIYVWFDALNIYQSGIGFGYNESQYKKWWPADVHVIGKGITRFHAVYWPAFLLSAKLPLPKTIFAHGYITVEGQKMSKTLGNVIDPTHLAEKYGVDPLRYYLLREIPAYDDGDFSENRFKEVYNADLANNIGNLVSRVARLSTQTEHVAISDAPDFKTLSSKESSYTKFFDEFRFNDTLNYVIEKVNAANIFIDKQAPWKQTGKDKTDTINALISQVQTIATLLLPFIPQTAEKILEQFKGPMILSLPPLFPRLK